MVLGKLECFFSVTFIPGTESPGSCKIFIWFRCAKIAKLLAVTCYVLRHYFLALLSLFPHL